jgi:hypothetical protein
MRASAPLLRLPCDAIREISEILADIWPPCNPHCGFPRGDQSLPLGWITLTHVCRPLRYTLLDRRGLWADVAHIFSGDAQAEMLTRAAGCPVSFVIPGELCIHTASRVQTMSRNLSRSREVLVLPRTRESFVRDVRRVVDILARRSRPRVLNPVDRWPLHPAVLSGRSLPHLRRLEVSIKIDERLKQLSSDIFALPPVDAPRMQRLLLFNVYVPFNARTLVSLNLGFSNHRRIPHPRPTAPRLFEMLRSCPQLQELALCNMIPPGIPLVANATVFFPGLTALDINDDFDRALALWSHLGAPPTASYSATLTPLAEDLRAHLHLLEQRIKAAIGPSARFQTMSAKEYKDSHGCFAMAFSTAPPPSDDPHSAAECLKAGKRHSVRVMLQAAENGPFDDKLNLPFLDGVTIFRHMTEAFDLRTHLEYLKLTPNPHSHASVARWHTVLRPLAGLRTLQFNGLKSVSDTQKLLDLFRGPVHWQINAPTQPLFLPALRDLWVTSTREDNFDYGSCQGPSSKSLAHFLELLTSRVQAGAGIKRLRIEKLLSWGDRDVDMVVSLLKEIVPHFESYDC